MAITSRRVVFTLLSVVFLAGCDERNDNPLSPVSPTPVSGSPAPLSMTITGATSLDHPGATGQLSATVTFSDNTSKDVTAEAAWLSPEGLIAVDGPGLIRAVRYGTGTVNAR